VTGRAELPTVTTLLTGYSLGSDQGSFAFCGVNLVEGRDAAGRVRRIVVDTGHAGRHLVLREALRKRDLLPSDIDVVVLTHAHWDHVQNVDLFDRAVLVVHPRELRYIKTPHRNDHATPRWTRAVLEQYDIQEATDGTELLPGVAIIEAPGHSAGTIAVTVTTDNGTAVISGDAIQDSEVARRRRNALVFWNEEQANCSVSRLVDLADVIYPGHDRAFRLSSSGAIEYMEEFSFRLLQASPSMQGFRFGGIADFRPNIMEGIDEQGVDWD
jgi:N-acyl homoserine lactone hydrolase